jgi:GNAT superfamily N-acetyltransferase
MHASHTARTIRKQRVGDLQPMLGIINSAAEAYRGVIPADCWREPYMSSEELQSEIAAGVDFVCCDIGDQLVGLMGVQPVHNVTLIRHAYVSPDRQSHGIGGALLAHLRAQTMPPILIGTWAAASWAIRFYERHGFELVSDAVKKPLLETYWTVSPRQIETSVVLAFPPLSDPGALELLRRRADRG